MKKFLVLTVLAVVTLGFIGFVSTARAAEYRSNDNVTVSSDEVIEDDLFIAGNILQIDGDVEGDVYAAGQQITVNGQIGGDLIVAGSTITVNGDVGGSVRAAGQSLSLSSAEVGGGVTFFGSTMSLASDSTIGRGLVYFGESITVNGTVTHGVTGFGSRVTINGAIGTDSKISAERLRINEGAVISGDVEYRSDQDAEVADGAQVAGELTRAGGLERFGGVGDWRVGRYVFTLWSFISALLVGAVLLLLARRPLADVAAVVRNRPLASFGWGLVAMLVTIPLGTLLMVTVFGIPLAILLWVAFAVGLYISKFIVGIALGWILLSRFGNKKTPSLFVSFIVGLVALYAINLIPVVSVFASLVIGALGLGALVVRLSAAVRHQRVASVVKK